MATLYHGCHLVTMDDDAAEHPDGWLLVEEGLVAAVGGGEPPGAAERVDLGGAVVTPGLVNTHHHLYQTLTRARAQDGTLFEWLVELYPVWAGIDAESVYAAARTGLAELALSGCTTVFDHHYVFPRGPGRADRGRTACRPRARCADRGVARLDGPRRLAGWPSARQPGRVDRRDPRGHGAARCRGGRRVGPDRRGTVLAVLRHAGADDRVGRARATARAGAPHASRGDRGGGRVLRRALRLSTDRVPRAARLAR